MKLNWLILPWCFALVAQPNTSLPRIVAGTRRRSPQTYHEGHRVTDRPFDYTSHYSKVYMSSTCITTMCSLWTHGGVGGGAIRCVVGGESGRRNIYGFWWCALVVHRDRTKTISRGANDSRASKRGAPPDMRHVNDRHYVSTVNVKALHRYLDTYRTRIYSLVW